MDFLRKYRNRYITSIELVSATDDGSFLISPADGFTEASIPVEYNGVYFTISSASLTENSKKTKSGTIYELTLGLSMPLFPGSADFKKRFSQLSEIRLKTNTGTLIRLNRNDVSLNRPIDVKMKSNLKTLDLDMTITQLSPFEINEQ